MRWEDERYVRLYTRDSATWAMLPWQSRCLLPLLLRKVDRAGVLEVVAGEETAAVAELVRAPLDFVEEGLAGLKKRGVVVVAAGKLRLPAFLAAQEAKQSDKARQQKSRELASLVESMSHAVTGGHTPSQDVTPSRAVPCRAVTNRTVPKETESAAALSRSRLVSDRLVASFAEVRPEQGKYKFAGTKDGPALARLLKACDSDDEIDARWRLGLAAVGWQRVSTIAQLDSKWNDIGGDETIRRDKPTKYTEGNANEVFARTARGDPQGSF